MDDERTAPLDGNSQMILTPHLKVWEKEKSVNAREETFQEWGDRPTIHQWNFEAVADVGRGAWRCDFAIQNRWESAIHSTPDHLA
jgi:hypothetical protein